MDNRGNCMGRRAMIKQLCGIVLSGLVSPRLLLELQNGNLNGPFRPPIQVIAVGSGACNILNHLIETPIQDLKTIFIGPDVRYVKTSQADIKIQIGRRLCRGFSCNGDPDLGRLAALEDRPKIKAVLRPSRRNLIIACLGGGTGTGAGPLVADWSNASGAHTLAIVTMPFWFEGKGQFYTALKGLREFQRRVKSIYIHHNEVPTKYRNRPVIEVFKINDDKIEILCSAIIDKMIDQRRVMI